MSDLRDFFDKFIEADRQRGEFLARKRRLAEMRERALKRCGNCNHWMKSRACPMERNVNGFSRGPSANAPPCGKFKSNSTHLEWIAEHDAARDAFIKTNGESLTLQ